MPEESVWRGRSSQWKNLARYVICAVAGVAIVVLFALALQMLPAEMGLFGPFILVLLLVPFSMALARYLQTKTKTYELTTERMKITQGVFSKVTDTLELYRVKDLETRQPFLFRIVGLENVQLNTSDASSPSILIDAIPAAVGLADKIRHQVEIIRTQKGAREFDIQ